MWYKTEQIAITFLVCTVLVVLLLTVADVPLTPVWLIPVVGGMLTGIAGASLNKLLRRPARSGGRLTQEHIEASVQLVLGIAFLVVGYFSV